MLSVFGCGRTRNAPCVSVELIASGDGCDVWEPETYVLYARPRIDGTGEAMLSFLEGSVPKKYLSCCTRVRVRADWPEYGVRDAPIFDGVLSAESRDRVIDSFSRRADSVEWKVADLVDALNRIVIAAPEGDATAAKAGNAADVAYEYLTDWASGSCVEITPPPADVVASAGTWEGDRSGEYLGDTIRKIAAVGGFDVIGEIVESEGACCYVTRYRFGRIGRNRDNVLSPCLDNADIRRVDRSCDYASVAYAFGVVAGVPTMATAGSVSGCTKPIVVRSDAEDTTATALQTLAAEALATQSPQERITFDIVWGCAFRPIIDLSIGDEFELLDDDGTIRRVRAGETPLLVVDDALVEAGAIFEVIP